MTDGQKFQDPGHEDQIPELKKIAYMYHAFGNYAKADEIMGVVRDIQQKRQARQDNERRKDAA